MFAFKLYAKIYMQMVRGITLLNLAMRGCSLYYKPSGCMSSNADVQY